jgi:hypothetical protein
VPEYVLVSAIGIAETQVGRHFIRSNANSIHVLLSLHVLLSNVAFVTFLGTFPNVLFFKHFNLAGSLLDIKNIKKIIFTDVDSGYLRIL